MTASERARRLLADVIVAAMARDQLTDTTTALLAYVADLEDCVAAARIEVARSDKYGCRELRIALAALDRPEDGDDEMSTTIYHEDDGEAVVELSARRTPGGYYLIETIDGGESNTIYLPNDSHARLLALLAPEPEPSDAEIDLNTRMTLTIPLHDVLSLWDAITFDERSCVNYVHDADGEPFDVTGATIDALETALIRAKRLPENPCLAAARAARQTGGANG